MVHSTYYISSGKQNKMYTLRHSIFTEGFGIVDNFIKTLSNDANVAEIKAKRYLDKIGHEQPFISFDVDELDPIFRFSRGELAEQRKLEEERKEAEKFEREQKETELRKEQAIIKEAYLNGCKEDAERFFEMGKLVFGKYAGQYTKPILESVPMKYFKYIQENIVDRDTFIVKDLISAQMKYIADLVRDIEINTPELKPQTVSTFQGSIGDKLSFDATCILATGYTACYDGFNTTWVDLYVVQDDDGNVYKIIYTGTRWSMEKDEKYRINGKVKSHDVYNEINQTVLNYVKVSEIKEKEAA